MPMHCGVRRLHKKSMVTDQHSGYISLPKNMFYTLMHNGESTIRKQLWLCNLKIFFQCQLDFNGVILV